MFSIGIISYLPNDNELRTKRLQAHIKQLEWLKEWYPGIDINCIYQNYKEEEIPKEFITSYEEYTNGIGAAASRNVLLEKFYHSDKDYMLLLDDDRLMYDYYDAKNFINDLIAVEKPNTVPIVMPLDPRFSPFKQENYRSKHIVETDWIIERNTSIMCSGIYIIGNIKKYHDKEIYFDENMDAAKSEGYEDADFLLQFMRNKLGVYKCKQLIVKSLNSEDSVIFDGMTDRLNRHKQNLKALADKYSDIGVVANSSGSVSLKKVQLFSMTSILVSRSKKYEFKENLIYSKKTNKAGRLF